jgi:carboxyl-terminal processing protease
MRIITERKFKQVLVGIAVIFMLLPQQMLFSQTKPDFSRPATADKKPLPKEIVEAALQQVETDFIDPALINGEAWQSIRSQYQQRSYNSSEEAYNAIRDMLKVLKDPRTRFLDPKEFKQELGTGDQTAGIGIRLAIDDMTKQMIVIEPIDNEPAQKAGIQAKDMVLKIDGYSTQGMEVIKAAALLRGKEGLPVTVTVQRGKKVLDFKIKRKIISLPAVRWNSQDVLGRKVGYIRWAQFSANATEETRKAIESLERKAVDGYVLDLRGTPGGLLQSGMEITRLWLNQGLIATFVDRKGEKTREEATQTALTQKPVVILVDANSAAASEILASALQENQRAKLVGVRTFGLNTVQSVKPLPDGSVLAVTVLKWLTPKGGDINGKGVEPDVNVPLPETDRKLLSSQPELIGTISDSQYAKALEVLNQLIQSKN